MKFQFRHELEHESPVNSTGQRRPVPGAALYRQCVYKNIQGSIRALFLF